MIPSSHRRCRAAADFVDFVIASTAEPEQLIEFANQLVGRTRAAFILPMPT